LCRGGNRSSYHPDFALKIVEGLGIRDAKHMKGVSVEHLPSESAYNKRMARLAR